VAGITRPSRPATASQMKEAIIINAGQALISSSPVLLSTLNIRPKTGVPFTMAVAMVISDSPWFRWKSCF
jgi:hypothetical protein